MSFPSSWRPEDSVCEPEPAALLEWRYSHGKFIRLGLVVLMATGDNIYHVEIVRAALQHKSVALRERTTVAAEMTAGAWNTDNVLDAGHIKLELSADALETVEIFGSSSDFGRADEEGRQTTADLIQQRLQVPVLIRPD